MHSWFAHVKYSNWGQLPASVVVEVLEDVVASPDPLEEVLDVVMASPDSLEVTPVIGPVVGASVLEAPGDCVSVPVVNMVEVLAPLVSTSVDPAFSGEHPPRRPIVASAAVQVARLRFDRWQDFVRADDAVESRTRG